MISVDRLELRDFRSYETVAVEFARGLTAVVGANGNGKTNLIEAIAFVARLASFRGAPNDALVRVGAERAVIRAEITCGDREVLVEAEVPPTGRPRVLVNKQRLARRSDMAEVLTTTVFSPDDLEIVKGGPSHRRDYLDDLLVDLHPKNEAAVADFAKALRQRNALLKQLGGRLGAEAEVTLDVWDGRVAELGERLASLREKVVGQLDPLVADAYARVSDGRVSDAAGVSSMRYAAAWRVDGLAAALAAARGDDLRRGVSTVGPHRDDVDLTISGLPARTHASQGEQRSLVLALRLAGHELVTRARGEAPVLLLDDVFSELDPRRSAALLECLPAGQRILTTAAGLPPGAVPDARIEVAGATATSSPVEATRGDADGAA